LKITNEDAAYCKISFHENYEMLLTNALNAGLKAAIS